MNGDLVRLSRSVRDVLATVAPIRQVRVAIAKDFLERSVLR